MCDNLCDQLFSVVYESTMCGRCYVSPPFMYDFFVHKVFLNLVNV